MPRKHIPIHDSHERGTEISLFRYGLIAPLLFGSLSAGGLEKALREIAAKTYTIPYSTRTTVGISTLRRYLKLYQKRGFEALRPPERSDRRKPRVFSSQVLEKAIAIREQQPSRTTTMIVELMKLDPELKGIELPNPHTLAMFSDSPAIQMPPLPAQIPEALMRARISLLPAVGPVPR